MRLLWMLTNEIGKYFMEFDFSQHFCRNTYLIQYLHNNVSIKEKSKILTKFNIMLR